MSGVKYRKNWLIISGFGLSVVILAAILLQLDWAKFVAEFQKVQLKWVIPLIVVYFGTFWIRVLRWRVLLPVSTRPTHGELWKALIIGFFASNLLPLRAGEIVRPWILSRSKKVSFSLSLASIVTERVLDVLALLVLLGWCLQELDSVPPIVVVGAKTLGVLALCVTLFIFASYVASAQVYKVCAFLMGLAFRKRNLPLQARLLELITEFLRGLRGINSTLELFTAVFLSLLLWLVVSLFYQLGLYAFGVDAPLLVGVVVNVIVALAVAAPSAPGYIGTFQAGCVLALSVIFSYSTEFAFAYSILLHGFQYVVLLVAGFICLSLLGLHVGDLQRRTEQ